MMYDDEFMNCQDEFANLPELACECDGVRGGWGLHVSEHSDR